MTNCLPLSFVDQDEDEQNTESGETDIALEDNTEIFGQFTRTGAILAKIKNVLNDCEGKTQFDNESSECIFSCGRQKAMLLLPCQHQHTCKQCWLVCKMESLRKISHEIFNNSNCDDLMLSAKPMCPVCKLCVEQEFVALK